jgi:ABC-type oligopeptide transport system ATPase subunit
MTVILRTEGLNKTYRLGGFGRSKTIRALNEVNLNVESDKPVIISVVGESGSGKTTLAKTLLRLVEPSAGRAYVYDKLVAGKGVKPARGDFLASIQPIFQNPFDPSRPTFSRPRRASPASIRPALSLQSSSRSPRSGSNTPTCAASTPTSSRAASCSASRSRGR